ncbi:MAG: hypothetical protein AB1391_00375 [Candidatus Micrarchaeota archaeon]
MTNIDKVFKCAMCSTDFPVSLTTDLEISDLTIFAKCPKCNNPVQIHLGIIGQPPILQQQTTPPNLDENIFIPPEIPSDEIKQLIDE